MKVSIIMGSKSDWEVMSAACETLEQFGVPFEKKVISAHRTPQFFCIASVGTGAMAGALIAVPSFTPSRL